MSKTATATTRCAEQGAESRQRIVDAIGVSDDTGPNDQLLALAGVTTSGLIAKL